MSERLCVVMPVYNEQDAIGPVLEKWVKALNDLSGHPPFFETSN